MKKPFSKSMIVISRFECYIISLVLLAFVWYNKDVSSVSVLASLSWGGYAAIRSLYIWMAKHEHVMDKKIEYKKLGLDSSNLDNELENIENQEIIEEVY